MFVWVCKYVSMYACVCVCINRRCIKLTSDNKTNSNTIILEQYTI